MERFPPLWYLIPPVRYRYREGHDHDHDHERFGAMTYGGRGLGRQAGRQAGKRASRLADRQPASQAGSPACCSRWRSLRRDDEVTSHCMARSPYYETKKQNPALTIFVCPFACTASQVCGVWQREIAYQRKLSPRRSVDKTASKTGSPPMTALLQFILAPFPQYGHQHSERLIYTLNYLVGT